MSGMEALMADELKLAIDVFKDANATVNSLWALYSGAALGISGYIIGSKKPVPGRGKLGLAVVFLVFAAANVRSLWAVQSIAYTAHLAIDRISAQMIGVSNIRDMLSQLTVSPPAYVCGFQIFLTICVLVAIWAVHRHEAYVRTILGK